MALFVDEGVRYPFRGERSTDLLAAGGVLGIATAISLQLAALVGPSVLAVPFVGVGTASIVALLGYLCRVFAATVDGDDEPPRFRPFGPLFRDGCRVLAVSLCFAVPPIAIVAVTVGGLSRVSVSAASFGFVGSLLFFGASTVVLLTALAFGYAYPVAVGRLADGGRLRDALEVRRYRSVLGHGSYFTGWGFAVLFVVPGWAFLLTAVSSATALGVIAVFVTFYAHVVAARLVARGYRRAANASSSR